MWKELREIREKIGPFNNNKEKVATNPFKEGHLILIHQQPMEKTHKMSPKRWGAYKYRIHSKYSMRTKRARRPPMYEIVKSSVDRWTMVMSSLSPIRGAWDMPRFSVRSDGREGWWPVALSTSWRKGTNGHSRARPRRARLIYIYIWGVPAWGGQGSTEVAQILAKQFWLPKPLYRWQRRKLAYVRKQYGHRSGEAGVVCESQP